MTTDDEGIGPVPRPAPPQARKGSAPTSQGLAVEELRAAVAEGVPDAATVYEAPRRAPRGPDPNRLLPTIEEDE